MTSGPLRFQPLDPKRFPLGTGPFRARGLAFVAALEYIDTRLPGGRTAFFAALGKDDPHAPYYDQLFVMSGDYDVSPLVRLYTVVAGLEGMSAARFIEDRSRWSARSTSQGLWKPLLKASSPEEMAERTHLAFNRYFTPCTAKPLGVQKGRFDGELAQIPACMNGIYRCATAGFISGAVELVGAKQARFEWQRPTPDGEIEGVPLEKVRFSALWSA